MPQSVASPDDSPWTENRILGGQVVLRQPARGYRAGMDAALLAAACGTGQRIFEAGCGVGGALLATARRQPDAQLVGLERQLGRGFSLECMASYLFDRLLFQGTNFSSGRTDVVAFAPGLGLSLQLLWRR